MRIMRLSTLLQQRLKDEVHDMSVLTEYRAHLLHAVGDYQSHVVAYEGNRTGVAEHPGLEKLGASFDQQIDALLKRLWDELVRDRNVAQAQLHNITTAIMKELKQDAAEESEFERLMATAGETHARVPMGGFDADEDEDHLAAEDEDSSLGVAIEAFHAKLQSNDSVLHLEPDTLAAWQRQYDSAFKALGDEEKEADMERISARINELLLASHIAPFDGNSHDSEMDYFGDLIYRAKLAPHRDSLLELLDAWQDGRLPLREPLERIEQLIDEDVLQPDVLYFSPDDYMYEDKYGDYEE